MNCRPTRLTAFLFLLGCAAIATAGENDDQVSDAKIVVVVGAPGSDDYGEQFSLWTQRWKDYAQQTQRDLEVIGTATGPRRSDREILQSVIRREVAKPETPLFIVFIGHGTHLRGTSKFNLRDQDFTDKELADWLAGVKRPLVIVQCASSSAAFLPALSGEDRVVITATRSPSEQNFSRFGDHFSAALTDPDADLDHDDAISLLEAFLLASNNVATFYRQDSRLATEHSLLDDNADRLGSSATFFRGIRAHKSAKDGAALDGLRAHQLVLFRLPGHVPLDPSLAKQRDHLENEIEALRQRKPSIPAEQYFAQLEPLMVKLARLYHSPPEN